MRKPPPTPKSPVKTPTAAMPKHRATSISALPRESLVAMRLTALPLLPAPRLPSTNSQAPKAPNQRERPGHQDGAHRVAHSDIRHAM